MDCMAVETIAKTNPLAQRKWQQGIGILISLACLVAAVWGIDFSKTIEYLQSAKAVALVIAALSVVLTLLAKSLRWRILLRSEKPVGWWRCFTVLNIGILINTLFPARLGDLARAFILAESERERKVYLIGTIAIEKIWDGSALLFTAFCLSWVVILPDWLFDPLRILAVLSLLGLFILGLVYWLWIKKRLKIELFSRWGKIGQWLSIQTQAVTATLARLRQEKVLFGFTLWTLLIVILGASTNYLIFLAFDLPLSFLPALFLLVVLMAGVSVPSVPGRFGVFHYLTVISLALFGVSKDLALVCGIVLHLITYLPTVLVGSYGLLRERTPWQWTLRTASGKQETNESPDG
jgi:uncharacterized protein (TIRG00374 family)